jgi:hypothetical protein
MEAFLQFFADLFIVVSDGKINKTRGGCLLTILVIFIVGMVIAILI